jgi:hypothetical protein
MGPGDHIGAPGIDLSTGISRQIANILNDVPWPKIFHHRYLIAAIGGNYMGKQQTNTETVHVRVRPDTYVRIFLDQMPMTLATRC